MAAILGPLISDKKLNFEQYLLNTHWYYTLQIHGITPGSRSDMLSVTILTFFFFFSLANSWNNWYRPSSKAENNSLKFHFHIEKHPPWDQQTLNDNVVGRIGSYLQEISEEEALWSSSFVNNGDRVWLTLAYLAFGVKGEKEWLMIVEEPSHHWPPHSVLMCMISSFQYSKFTTNFYALTWKVLINSWGRLIFFMAL